MTITITGRIEDIERFFSFLFPAFFFLVMESVAIRMNILKPTPRSFASGILLIWIVYPFARTVSNIHLFHKLSCNAEYRERIIENIPPRILSNNSK